MPMLSERSPRPEEPESEAIPPAIGGKRIDEMSEEELEEFSRRYHMVLMIDRGTSAREAMERVGFDRTPRWARKMYQRYKEHGVAGLIDGRKRNKNPAPVLTPEVRRVILGWWAARSAAGPKAIWKKAIEECREKGLPEPSYQSVWSYLDGLPEPWKLVRAGKLKTWDQQGRPVVRFQLAKHANERFQLDHTRLDLWARQWDGYRWVPVELWCTVALDEFSRAVAGVVVSAKHPDSWTTSMLLWRAVMPKDHKGWRNRGLPEVVQPDQGKDFIAHSTVAVFANLGVEFDPDPPYYPNRKGKVEAWFRSLDRGCLRLLPGHMDAVGKNAARATKHLDRLLTRHQILQEIERWIVDEYHQRTHTETDRKPAELWEETVRLRIVEDDDHFHAMLLKSDRLRVVRNTGIDFENNRYWAPHLTDYYRAQVRIRYNPEDDESILVYDSATGEFICEAWVMNRPDSKYTIKQVKQERRMYRRGVVQRTKDLLRENHEKDRQVARGDWTEPRDLAAEIREQERVSPEPAPVEDDVAALTDLFRRHDRGFGSKGGDQ